MKRIFFDHAGTTPVRDEVLEEMIPYFKEKPGNPSTICSFGREARIAIDKARERVAVGIGANPEEIFFTSGGTEADNWALRGVLAANKGKGNHIITTAIEHHAILSTCQDLEKSGYKITYLPVDNHGKIQIDDLVSAITNDTVLVSIMYANNEVGTLQPISEIGNILKIKRPDITFHTDAVQAIGKVPIDVDELKVDLLSLSAHKIYGPKGIGALYVRKASKIKPLITGGGQERRRRPGTENVPGIVGFGKAIKLAVKELDPESDRLTLLRDRLAKNILDTIPHSQLNGHPTDRLCNNVNISFNFIEGESLLLNLDMNNICASSGSACTSGSLDPSHVLLAMGLSHEIAQGSLRLTLGRGNCDKDIDYLLQVLPGIVQKLREMSPLYAHGEEKIKNV